MKRMAMVIDRDERQLRSKVESSKGDTFSGNVITDFLYGAEDGSHLGPSLDDVSRYATLRTWTNDDWVRVLRKYVFEYDSLAMVKFTTVPRYYIDSHHIVLIGKPSAAMVKRLEQEEKIRIDRQKKFLGEEGLKKMEQMLEEAKKEHEKEIPTEVLTSFPVPSVQSIAWIPVQSLQEIGKGPGRRKTVEQRNNEQLACHVQADGSSLPFFVEYEHVEVSPICVPVRQWK